MTAAEEMPGAIEYEDGIGCADRFEQFRSDECPAFGRVAPIWT